MIIHDDEGFYFDRIYILSRKERWELVRYLSDDKFIMECRSFKIIDTDSEQGVYRSRIEVVAPTADFLQILHINEALLGSDYKISRIEIAHDTFCDSVGDAELKADNLFRTVRKKYSFGHIFEGNPDKTKKERLKDRSRGLFAERTFYSSLDNEKGGRWVRFRYVLYARRSKMNNRPCVHKEWRIAGAGLIARKAGIRGIDDLVRFDFKEFFDTIGGKYIVHESINHETLGKWLNGFDGRKALTQQEKHSVDLAVQHFLQSHKIETYSDLVLFFRDEMSSINEKRGVRSAWEKKVMALKDCRRFRAL